MLHLRNIMVLSVTSLILHTIWEYAVCEFFYIIETEAVHNLMWSAISGDIIMTLTLYGILVFVNMEDRNWYIKKLKRNEYVIILFYGLFLSFYFEASALYTGRWSYTEWMPLFPNTNIGLIPMLQLVILLPFTFWILRRITLLKKFPN